MSAQPLTKMPTPDELRLERARHDSVEETNVAHATEQLMALLKEAVEQLGGYEFVAGLAGLDRSDLRRALHREPGRFVRVEAVVAIGARLSRVNPTLTTKLGFALVSAMGLGVFPLVTLPVEEQNARMKQVILGLPHGEQILAETLGVRR
jgi:hypothetical protein